MLMTDTLKRRFAEIGEQLDAGFETRVVARYFEPWSRQVWYATEFFPESGSFFGYVTGEARGWHYFRLDELESIRGPGDLLVVRDTRFPEQKLRYALERDRR